MKRLQFIFVFLSPVYLTIASSVAAKTNMIALIPQDKQFLQVIDGMRSELDANYNIDIVSMTKSFKFDDVTQACKKNDVKALILMDEAAINAIRELQEQDDFFKSIPKFVFMTLQVENSTKGLSNVAGIKFEVPIYTLVTNFRIISQKDLSNIGIFYRQSFTGSIDEAKKMLEKEKISIDAVCVDCENNGKATVQKALSVMENSFDKMVKEQGSEAFLVLADNLIMNNVSLNDFWIGKVRKEKFPVIAPFEMLASKKVGLAIFAADPDLTQLGAQGANQIIEYFENGSPLETIGFEPTISIKSSLNESVAKELGWKLKTEKLRRINQIIK
jgi:ABC-type uncharacterized transport system substrate-binding protein